MTSVRQKKWRDMSTPRKVFLIIASTVQIVLAVKAWADLARRPKSQVRGPKAQWASIIGINFVGPLAYFRWGRMAGEVANDQPDAGPEVRHP